jgi:hypothetical protein
MKIINILNKADNTPAYIEFMENGRDKVLSAENFTKRYGIHTPEAHISTRNDEKGFDTSLCTSTPQSGLRAI